MQVWDRGGFQKWQDRQRQQTASKTRHSTPAWQSQLVARSLVSGKATNTTYYYRAEHRSSSWRRRSPCRNFHLTSSGVVTIWTVEIHRGKQRRKKRAAPTACTVCFFGWVELHDNFCSSWWMKSHRRGICSWEPFTATRQTESCARDQNTHKHTNASRHVNPKQCWSCFDLSLIITDLY